MNWVISCYIKKPSDSRCPNVLANWPRIMTGIKASFSPVSVVESICICKQLWYQLCNRTAHTEPEFSVLWHVLVLCFTTDDLMVPIQPFFFLPTPTSYPDTWSGCRGDGSIILEMMLSPWQWCYLQRPSLSVAPGNQMKNMCSVELCEIKL